MSHQRRKNQNRSAARKFKSPTWSSVPEMKRSIVGALLRLRSSNLSLQLGIPIGRAVAPPPTDLYIARCAKNRLLQQTGSMRIFSYGKA
jgi:hypothetical protein